MPGDIRHKNPEVFLIYHDEVVEIAGD